MPLKVPIMDSSLAQRTYTRAVGSLSYTFLPVQLPFVLFRFPALLLSHLLVAFSWLPEQGSRKPNMLKQIGIDLSNTELVDGQAKRAHLCMARVIG